MNSAIVCGNFRAILNTPEFGQCRRCLGPVKAMKTWEEHNAIRIGVLCHGERDERLVTATQLEADPGRALESVKMWFDARPLRTLGLNFRRHVARRALG